MTGIGNNFQGKTQDIAQESEKTVFELVLHYSNPEVRYLHIWRKIGFVVSCALVMAYDAPYDCSHFSVTAFELSR